MKINKISLIIMLGCLLFCTINCSKKYKSEIEFRLHFYEWSKLNDCDILIHFSDGKSTKSLSRKDFNSAFTSQTFETEESGKLTIDFTISDSLADSISHGIIELPIKSDWIWDVVFDGTNNNPYKTCFGCTGYKSFDIIETYKDTIGESLFVTWGGNSISNPATY